MESINDKKLYENKDVGLNMIKLNEPDYYAKNGLSPLKAYEQGLLSYEEYKGFLKGNIIKYTVRCDGKGEGSSDMVKCIDYCNHLKELIENKSHEL